VVVIRVGTLWGCGGLLVDGIREEWEHTMDALSLDFGGLGRMGMGVNQVPV